MVFLVVLFFAAYMRLELQVTHDLRMREGLLQPLKRLQQATSLYLNLLTPAD